MLTAYDYPTALAVDQAGIESILVGDSLGMVVLGYANTLPVTMEDDAAPLPGGVARGKGRPAGRRYALHVLPGFNAGGGAQRRAFPARGRHGRRQAGGRPRAPGSHPGHRLDRHPGDGPPGPDAAEREPAGGFRPQGKNAAAASRILEDAQLLQEAGCFSIVLESVPARLAKLISERLEIPTIGIGAGAGCDGQVLVTHDLLGLFSRFAPRFVKKYADLHAEMARAFQRIQSPRWKAALSLRKNIALKCRMMNGKLSRNT